jgi:hypothetical protein
MGPDATVGVDVGVDLGVGSGDGEPADAVGPPAVGAGVAVWPATADRTGDLAGDGDGDGETDGDSDGESDGDETTPVTIATDPRPMISRLVPTATMTAAMTTTPTQRADGDGRCRGVTPTRALTAAAISSGTRVARVPPTPWLPVSSRGRRRSRSLSRTPISGQRTVALRVASG